jgi:hypothetical protein
VVARRLASGRDRLDLVARRHGTRAGACSPGQSAYASSPLVVSFATDAPCFAATSLTGYSSSSCSGRAPIITVAHELSPPTKT